MTAAIGSALAAIATLVWLWLLINLANLRRSDHAGNGLAEVFAVATAFLLWLLLAATWATVAIGIGIAGWLGAAIVMLLPLSGAAALAGFSVMTRRGAAARTWPGITLVAVPPIVLADALCRLFPDRLPAPAPWLAWGAVLALSLLPWPLLIRR